VRGGAPKHLEALGEGMPDHVKPYQRSRPRSSRLRLLTCPSASHIVCEIQFLSRVSVYSRVLRMGAPRLQMRMATAKCGLSTLEDDLRLLRVLS